MDREEKVWDRTYGQIAVLLAVLADFLFCDGHRFRRVRLLLRLLWRVARAVFLGCDVGGERVCHGWERGRRRGYPTADDERAEIERS